MQQEEFRIKNLLQKYFWFIGLIAYCTIILCYVLFSFSSPEYLEGYGTFNTIIESDQDISLIFTEIVEDYEEGYSRIHFDLESNKPNEEDYIFVRTSMTVWNDLPFRDEYMINEEIIEEELVKDCKLCICDEEGMIEKKGARKGENPEEYYFDVQDIGDKELDFYIDIEFKGKEIIRRYHRLKISRIFEFVNESYIKKDSTLEAFFPGDTHAGGILQEGRPMSYVNGERNHLSSAVISDQKHLEYYLQSDVWHFETEYDINKEFLTVAVALFFPPFIILLAYRIIQIRRQYWHMK